MKRMRTCRPRRHRTDEDGFKLNAGQGDPMTRPRSGEGEEHAGTPPRRRRTSDVARHGGGRRPCRGDLHRGHGDGRFEDFERQAPLSDANVGRPDSSALDEHEGKL